MSDQNRITLDSPAFTGNLRHSPPTNDRPVRRPVSRAMSDVVVHKRTTQVYGIHLRPHALPQQKQYPQPSQVQPFTQDAVAVAVRIIGQGSAPRPLQQPKRPLQAQQASYQHHSQPIQQQPAYGPDQATQATISKAHSQKILKAPIKKHKRLRLRKPKLDATFAFRIAAFGFMLVGSLILFRYYRATQQIANAQTLPRQTAPADTDTPAAEGVPAEGDGAVRSEKPPTSNYKYSVAPGKAKKITIPAIGVNAFVRDVGIAKDGAMATPSNIYWLGWSLQGVLPGESGLAIANGHVSGPTAQGVFFKLNKLNVGDIVKVEKGDGAVVSYKVVAKESVPVADAATKLYQMKGKSSSQLNLITCDGKFNSKSDSFLNRLIVYTEKV